jgi:hypothetical protein
MGVAILLQVENNFARYPIGACEIGGGYCKFSLPNRRLPVRVGIGMPEWRNGRRAGFKILCPKGRVGSTPTSGTVAKSCFVLKAVGS